MNECEKNGHYCPNCDTVFPLEDALLRENAELAANNARLREALQRHLDWELNPDRDDVPDRPFFAETPAQFLEAIRAEEREACANLMKELAAGKADNAQFTIGQYRRECFHEAAAAIRARGGK